MAIIRPLSHDVYREILPEDGIATPDSVSRRPTATAVHSVKDALRARPARGSSACWTHQIEETRQTNEVGQAFFALIKLHGPLKSGHTDRHPIGDLIPDQTSIGVIMNLVIDLKTPV